MKNKRMGEKFLYVIFSCFIYSERFEIVRFRGKVTRE